MIPPYAPSVPDWMRTVANALNPILRRFQGSADYQKENLPGFNYTANLNNVTFIENRGTAADPVSDPDACVLISKSSSTASGEDINPALAVQHYAYGERGTGVFAEAIDLNIDPNGFVEGARFHGIARNGAKGYGCIGYGQGDDADALNVVGFEGEVARSAGVDAVDPGTWANGNPFDTMFIATARAGFKPMAGFVLNPYNTVKVRVGFMVGNSSAAQGASVGIADFASFGSFEDSVPNVLYARGTGIGAIVNGPNNVPYKARNAANSADLDILKLDGSNILQLGAGASGYGVKLAALGNYANDAAAATGGVAVGGLYRNGSVLMVRAA